MKYISYSIEDEIKFYMKRLKASHQKSFLMQIKENLPILSQLSKDANLIIEVGAEDHTFTFGKKQ